MSDIHYKGLSDMKDHIDEAEAQIESAREQILKLCEFDAKAARRSWTHSELENWSNMTESRICVHGAQFENARLLPIITALLERVEQLEGVCKRAKIEMGSTVWREEHIYWELEQALATSPLDKILNK